MIFSINGCLSNKKSPIFEKQNKKLAPGEAALRGRAVERRHRGGAGHHLLHRRIRDQVSIMSTGKSLFPPEHFIHASWEKCIVRKMKCMCGHILRNIM
jgi:hypothetical protein